MADSEPDKTLHLGPDDQVIMPLGWLAGKPIGLADALTTLAIEMMAHRSDLLEIAEKGKMPEPERELHRRRATDLERYATAINALALQVDPERWKHGDYSGLLELARENSITLPEWMTK
jgi:hypothetical protein